MSRLRAVRREDIDPEYCFTSDFEGYRQAGPIILSPEERDRVGATVALATEPAAPHVVKAELARLRVSTKSRNERDTDLALGMQAYADILADYPPDIVRSVCRAWPRREKFFPAVAELVERLDRAMKSRASLKKIFPQRDRDEAL